MPEPSVTETAFRTLIRAFGRLDRVMAPYFARFGLSGAQWGVLRNLHRAEQDEGLDALRLSDLGRRLLVRPPSVTGIVDRLERAGLVVRSKDNGDRRGRLVALTSAGRRLVERVLVVHIRQIERVMGGLTLREHSQLGGLLLKLNRHLEKLEASAPAPVMNEGRVPADHPMGKHA